MQTISRKGIEQAAWLAGSYFPFYKSHIAGKLELETGLGIQFDSFNDLGSFLVQLGAQASFDEHNRHTSSAPKITLDDAQNFASDLQIDPISDGLVAFFPGWEFSDE